MNQIHLCQLWTTKKIQLIYIQPEMQHFLLNLLAFVFYLSSRHFFLNLSWCTNARNKVSRSTLSTLREGNNNFFVVVFGTLGFFFTIAILVLIVVYLIRKSQ